MNILDLLSLDQIVIFFISIISLLLGRLFQKIIIPRLRKRSARNRSVNLRIFLNNIQGPFLIWVVLGTFYGLGSYFVEDSKTLLGKAVTTSLILIIITFTYVIGQVIKSLLTYYIRKGILPNTTIFNSLSTILILFIGIGAVLSVLGISITPIFAALGIGGLAVALALQPTLANLFAGMSIIASKQLNPGDFVELSPTQSGYIDDIQWRTTTIRTIQNNLVIVPNSMMSNMVVTNYSLPAKELSLPIPVGVHYDSDLDHVRDVCIEVAKLVLTTEEGGVKDFQPVVRFKQFGPSSIDLNVVLRINEFNQQHHIRSEFIRILRKRFKEEGIIIPYPITTVEFGDRDNPTGID